MTIVFDFDSVFTHWDMLVHGALLTLRLSAETMVLGLIVGILGGYARVSSYRALRIPVRIYVEVIRNTPFLVQLLFIFLGLPYLGVRFTPETAALIAMVVNFSAYAIEIVRAGIEAVDSGQIDAGRALGMRESRIFTFIVLPPAISFIYPALCSQFILVMLGSSVVSAISAQELTAAANDLQGMIFRPFEIFIVVGAMYLVATLLFETFFHFVERRLFRFRFAG
jgi:polar amino acid transport system permease protein